MISKELVLDAVHVLVWGGVYFCNQSGTITAGHFFDR